jgi:alkanesulfonate monooxygenase SsuD/methylene tetrahydromethanopterin reductase-like flavin-dependent oxidoreductase (luciferase family)
MLVRRLLDGERVSHDGRFYTFHDAICEPRPVQARLPILVGGSGPKKTLRTTALRADAWNTSGFVEEAREKVATLDRHCAEVGRDPAEIERTISFPIVLRDEPAAAERAFADLLRHNGSADAGKVPNLLGPPQLVAEQIAPYRDMGFSTVIARLPAPHDRETIERIGEVAALLGEEA